MDILWIVPVLALVSSSFGELTLLTALKDTKGVRVWDDKGSIGRYEVIIWEPNVPANGWFLLGQRAQSNYRDLKDPVYSFKPFVNNTSTAKLLARPTFFQFIWDSRGGTTYEPGSIWRPVCPKGFVALGDYVYRGDRLSEPPSALYRKARCVREDITELCAGWRAKVWDNAGAFGDYKASLWAAEADQNTGVDTNLLYGNKEHNIRPALAPRCLKKAHFRVESLYD